MSEDEDLLLLAKRRRARASGSPVVPFEAPPTAPNAPALRLGANAFLKPSGEVPNAPSIPAEPPLSATSVLNRVRAGFPGVMSPERVGEEVSQIRPTGEGLEVIMRGLGPINAPFSAAAGILGFAFNQPLEEVQQQFERAKYQLAMKQAPAPGNPAMGLAETVLSALPVPGTGAKVAGAVERPRMGLWLTKPGRATEIEQRLAAEAGQTVSEAPSVVRTVEAGMPTPPELALSAPTPAPAAEISLDEFLTRFEGKMKPGVVTKEGKFVGGWDHGDAFNRAEELGYAVPEKVGEASAWKIADQIVTDQNLLDAGVGRDSAGMYEFLKKEGRLPASKVIPAASVAPPPAPTVTSTITPAGASRPAEDVVQSALKDFSEASTPPIPGLTKALDAPTELRLALDRHMSGVVKPFFDGLWEMVPPSVQARLADLSKTSAEKVSPVLASLLQDAEHQFNTGRLLDTAAGKRLEVAIKEAGIPPGSSAHKAIYRYIGDEEGFQVWPEGNPLLPESVKARADDIKRDIVAGLEEGVRLKNTSAANLKEHTKGFLSRYYDAKASQVLEEYGFRNANRSKQVRELFMRSDSYGGVVHAPQAEVEAILREAGVDPAKIPYIHELEGKGTGFKLGTDDAAMALRDQLRERFGKAWDSDLRPLSIEERMDLAERMDPVEASVRTLQSIHTRNTMSRLQEHLAEKFSSPPTMNAAGYPIVPDAQVLVPKEPKWGALGGRLVDKKVFAHIENDIEQLDATADFIGGMVSGARGGLIRNLGSAVVNTTTNGFAGFLDGIGPLDPGSYPAIGRALHDAYLLKTKGIVTPAMQQAIDVGLNPAGIAGDLLDTNAELVAQEFSRPRSAWQRGKLTAEILADDPTLTVAGLSPWTNRALAAANSTARGALYGGLVGGPAGAAAGAATAAVTSPLRRAMARVGGAAFSAGDPLYQLGVFYRNMERTGGDAAAAWERSKDIVQLYGRSDMPETVLQMTGRAPGQSGTARTIGQLFGPLFPGYPVNLARMGYTNAVKHPASLIMAGAGVALTAQIMRDRALVQGAISPEGAKALEEQSPLSLIIPTDDGTGAYTLHTERLIPTPDSAFDFTRTGVGFGIGTNLGARAAFATAPDSTMPAILGGWTARKAKEERNPGAALLRMASELSPYSAGGRGMQTIEKAANGQQDFSGNPFEWWQAVVNLSIGVRSERVSDEALLYEKRKERQQQKRSRRRVNRSSSLTDTEREFNLEGLTPEEK